MRRGPPRRSDEGKGTVPVEKWLPHNVSTYGGEIDDLFVLIYRITGVVFILVALALLGFLIVYRDKKDGRRATYSHGNNTLEIIWTVIPALVDGALAQARLLAVAPREVGASDLASILRASLS